MDYGKDFLEAQKKMFGSFQEMYSPFFGEKKEENSSYTDKVKEYFDMQKKWMETWTTDLNPFQMYQKMMETPGFNMDAFKTFLDMQNQYFENMKTMGDFYKKGFGENAFSPFDFKNINEAFDKYKEFYSQFGFEKLYDPKMYEVMDKMFDANKLYLHLYDFWSELDKDFFTSTEKGAERFQEFINENANAAYGLIVSAFPNELRPFFAEPKELIEKFFGTMVRFYEPWQEDFVELRDLFVKGVLENDATKIADFFKLWKENYDQTFGKIINSPALGSNRNLIEQQNKAFDRFIEMLVVVSDFSTRLSAISNTSFQKVMKEFVETTKEGLEKKSFEEFFNFWSRKMDDYLVEYFGSKEFSSLLANMGAAAMDFKIETNKLIEYYLADTPLVTKGELDSLIKNVYTLKKEVKSLKKQLKALEDEKGEKKE